MELKMVLNLVVRVDMWNLKEKELTSWKRERTENKTRLEGREKRYKGAGRNMVHCQTVAKNTCIINILSTYPRPANSCLPIWAHSSKFQ